MSAVEPDGNLPDEDGATEIHWGRLGGIGAALGMSAVFAVAAWYALQRSDMQPPAAAEVPLVKAEPGPVKEKPEDPGGLKIPNQDKLVYERITPKPQAPKTEKLAPAPEEPIVKTAEAAKPAAPAAPVIATPTSGPEAAAKAAATQTEAAKPPAKAKEEPAAAKTHAAPPAITSKAEKTESLLPAAETKPKAAATPAAKPAAVKVPAKTVAVSEKPAAKPPAKPAPAKKVVAAKPTAPKAAPAKTVTSYRIQLASYRSAALAQKMWKKLQKTHAGILGSLAAGTARADLGKRGVYFRLQAGAFESEAKARAVCRQLKARKQDCIIVPPKR